MAASCGSAVLDQPLRNTLIVSHDPSLVEELRQLLAGDAQHAVRAASSFRDAEHLLDGWRAEAALIDLRHASAENPDPLLRRLGKRDASRVPVIAISDAGYVCDWALMADLVVSGHLQLPLDRQQLGRLLAAQLANGSDRRWVGPLNPRTVQARTITYRTFTLEMYPLLDELLTVAGHTVTVLLVGETGTGKTTLARLIHELSPRHESQLWTVACGSLPPELIESELFGHVKGAFTSADRNRQGKFEVAESGTLLLDEIDVLGPAQQAKLLRVIESNEFEPVGSNEVRTMKARLVVASNVDLRQLMEQNLFRSDLYYRLSMLELRIPALRERPRDIVPLALDFIEEFCASYNVLVRRVHPDFLACLKSYPWPGNVRELKNHVRRAVLFCRSGVLTPGDLAPQFHKALEGTAPAACAEQPVAVEEKPRAETLVARMASTERDALEQALRDHHQNRTAAARALGLSRVGLYKKMKRYGLLNHPR